MARRRSKNELDIDSHVLIVVGTGPLAHAESATITEVVNSKEGRRFRLVLDATGQAYQHEVLEEDVATDVNDLIWPVEPVPTG